jgi:transglutaminase-like putative cysteine protease
VTVTTAASSRDGARDQRFLAVLLLICAGAAIATLPTAPGHPARIHPGWVVAFVLPAAFYVALGTGWLRLLPAVLVQLASAATAYAWLGGLRPEAALALSLLPPLTFFTLRRRPHDTGLALFLSFCFLLIGTMLNHGRSDWRLLVFLCAGGLAMQVEASARARLIRHAHRGEPTPRWSLTASRAQIMAVMLLAGSLIYLGMGALPEADQGPSSRKPSRVASSNRRTVGLSHNFDLTGAMGSPLRIDADRVLLATAGDFRPVPKDLYLRMTYFDEAGTARWSTTTPSTFHEFSGPEGREIATPVPRYESRSLSMSLLQPMSNGELFVPPGVVRIRGVEPLELHPQNGWFRAPKAQDNRNYQVDYQRVQEFAHRTNLQDLQDPRLRALPRAFEGSSQLKELLAVFTHGLTPRTPVLERARRIARGLQSHCRYALREPAGDRADPLHRFLFGSREGYCMHFATALAVMLRLQNIPCRIGVGFYGGDIPPDDPSGHSRVFGSHHAHAWVEIPLELGRWRAWTVVDATPAADRTRPGWPPAAGRMTATSAPKEAEPEVGACMFSAIAPLLDEPLGFLDRPLDYPHTMVFLGVLILLGVLWSWAMFVRERRGKRQAPPEKKLTGDGYRVRRLLDQILRALERRGYPRPRNCTLETYLGYLVAADVAMDLDTLDRGFRAYQEVRFGTRALDSNRTGDMETALASVKRMAS